MYSRVQAMDWIMDQLKTNASNKLMRYLKSLLTQPHVSCRKIAQQRPAHDDIAWGPVSCRVGTGAWARRTIPRATYM
jgi:hypothetical protein